MPDPFFRDSFYHSVYQNHYDIDNKIEDFIPFPIIHVYGAVAKFETLDWPNHNYKADFNNYLLIEGLSKGIGVIGEERADEKKSLGRSYSGKDHIPFFADRAFRVLAAINDAFAVFDAAKASQ